MHHSCFFADIRIGFEREAYTFQEGFGKFEDTIVLIKENNRSTERTFEVVIEVGNARPSGISANAEFGVDYNVGPRVQTLRFFPTDQRLPFIIQLFGDEIPEGTEAFQLQSRNSNPAPSFNTPPRIAFANTFVIIEDDDSKWKVLWRLWAVWRHHCPYQGEQQVHRANV